MILDRSIEDLLGPLSLANVKADDGLRLHVQRFGRGPAVLLANGIGVRYPGMALQIAALRQHYEVITWDYRGIGQSTLSDPEGDVSMPRHARDALAVMEQLQLPSALVVGWSMGVQVGLELYRLAPERVTGLAALLGSYGLPFHNSALAPVAGLLQRGFGLLEQHPPVTQGAFDLAVALPRVAFSVLSKARFIGAGANQQVFAAAVRSVAGVEKKLYMRTMLALAEHTAVDLLPQIQCPVLVISGRRDYLTPPKAARQMVQQIPGAEYQEVHTGTHFSLMEQPDLVNSWLVEFAGRVLVSAGEQGGKAVGTSGERG